MIFEELLYAFRNDLEIEFLKRGILGKNKIKLNEKQIKLIFSKIIADLQKEFKIIQSSQTISSLNGEQTYALTRDFMSVDSVFYNKTKLEEKSVNDIYNYSTASGTPNYFAIKWENAYPILMLYPAPNADGKDIIVKSYNDMTLYSINDGLDPKSNETDVTKYLKIPTQYDSAVLLGMIAEIFDDKEPKYEKEKLRLKSLRHIDFKFDYNMTGVNDGFSKTNTNYNSGADATPTVLPNDPV